MSTERSEDRLRPSRADRRRAADILAAGLRDGRIDAQEYDRRGTAAEAVKSVRELNELLADLPAELGVREWADHLRVRAADRELAVRWLADASAEGRLADAEHERRLAALAAAGRYAEVKKLVVDVPGPPDAVRDKLRVSAADRQAVLDRIAQDLADGVLSEDEHAQRQADVRQAEHYRDLDRLAAGEPDRASSADRERVIRRLDRAYEAGQLDAGEHEKRTAKARTATRDATLARLLADVDGGTDRPARALLALNGRHRLSDAQRDHAVQELREALADDRLTLDEFDERVRTAYAASTVRQVKPLLADLIEPARAQPVEPVAAKPASKPAGKPAGGGRRWLPGAVLVAAVAAVVVGVVVHKVSADNAAETSTPKDPKIRWAAPFDRPSSIVGVGNWITADLAIRARPDKVVAYALADGHVAWTYPIPSGQQVCAMSRDVGQNLGLIGYGETKGCTTIVALDVTAGRAVWQRSRTIPEDAPDGHTDEIAVADGVAVIREPTGFVAVDLRQNTPKWRLPVAKGCQTYSVTAAGDTAALVSSCPDHAATLLVADAGTGRERWHSQLRTAADDERTYQYGWGKATVVLSLNPVVVRTSGEEALVSFDGQGRRQATIAESQDDLDIDLGSFPQNDPRAIPRALIEGDVLVVPATKAGSSLSTHVVAFSLTDGHRLWLAQPMKLWVSAISTVAGQILVTGDQGFGNGSTLSVLATGNGEQVSTVVGEDIDDGTGALEVAATGKGYLIMNANGTTSPPVAVLG